MLKKGKTLLLVLLTLFMIGSEVNVYVSAEESQDTDAEETTESSTSESRSGTSLTYETSTEDKYTVYTIDRDDYDSDEDAGYYLDYLIEKVISPTSSNPVKVVVEAGTYTKAANNTMYIPSYTWLYFKDGVTLKQASADDPGTFMKIGSSSECNSSTGYSITDITIQGESADSVTFDKNSDDDTLLQIGHGYNIVVDNITFTNIEDGHFIEVAGSQYVYITNCTFEDHEITDDADANTYEAIQLDILQSDHLSGYVSEDLANQDIIIDGCAFDDVVRGIGSHTATLNNPLNGLTISNNTFTNNKSCAISLMDIINAEIYSNSITGTPRGIFIFSYKNNNCYLPTSLDDDSTTSESYNTPSNRNIAIYDNEITLSGTDSYDGAYDSAGIQIEGKDLSSYTASSGDQLPSGNYYMTGVTISGNTIKTTCTGIKLADCRGITVDDNTIYHYTKSGDYRGIWVNAASKGIDSPINITGNYISYSSYKFQRGIYVADSSSVYTIDSNTIKSTSESAIYLYNSSKATYISSNIITSPAQYGIMLSTSSKATNINSNTIKSAGQNAIYAYSSSTATYIKSNTISSAGKYGISLYGNSTATTISSNTITSSTSYAIDIQSLKNSLTISSNKISGGSSYCIRIYPQTTSYTVTVSSNTLTGKSKKYYGIYASKAKVSIKSNTIKSCSDPVYVTTSAYASIYKNTLSSNTYNKYRIGSKRYANLGTPTLTISTKKKTSIKLKWTKKSGTGYQIYRSTSKSGTYSKVKSISSSSTLTYTNTGLKKSTTYYYKIRAIRKVSSKVTIYGSYSSIKSGKTTSK